jgi:hypothetical protein
MLVRVKDNTQVNHNGRVYGPGEGFDAPEDLTKKWLLYDWAREPRKEEPTGPKRRSAARNKR